MTAAIIAAQAICIALGFIIGYGFSEIHRAHRYRRAGELAKQAKELARSIHK